MQGGGIRRAIHKQQTIINENLASPNGRLTGCSVCLSCCRLASIPYLCMMPLLSMITPKILFYFLSLPALVGKHKSSSQYWLLCRNVAICSFKTETFCNEMLNIAQNCLKLLLAASIGLKVFSILSSKLERCFIS